MFHHSGKSACSGLAILTVLQAVRQHDGETSYGLAFAFPERLATLCRRGHFIVMNTSHCTSKLGWLLYNLMVRNRKGSWVTEAHVLTAMKDSDIVAAELRQVSLSFSTVHLLITLLYRLSSDAISDGTSATCSPTTPPVSNARFEKPFLGSPPASKRCRTSSAKSTPPAPFGRLFLTRRIRGVESTSSPLSTIERRGLNAKRASRLPSKQPRRRDEHIEKKWWKARADWAHYTRCSSALLLQVPSTNVVESWHASLKHRVKMDMAKWSLLGSVQHLVNVSVQLNRKAERVRAEFHTCHLSDTVFWLGMRKIPYSVQQLVLHEMHRGNELVAEGKEVAAPALSDELECDCLFFFDMHEAEGLSRSAQTHCFPGKRE